MRNRASPKGKNTAKRDNITSVIFLILVVIGILTAILYSSGIFSNLSTGDRIIDMDTNKEVKDKVELNSDIEENPNISYPGYDKLTFTSEQKKQEVYLINPKENTCYFVMSLILDDSNVIWQSEELMPGDAFNQIELDKALEKGNYENATLQYESYSLKDGRKLNGSSINLAIKVN